jgi:hypothetical protein
MASKSSQRFLVLCSTLALAAGCSQIIGLSDYEIDPSLNASAAGEGGNGDAGKGGSKPSTGGSQSTAGEPNGGQPTGPTGGAGGEPMTSPGGAGAGGEGGTGGAAPEPKFKGCDGTAFDGNEDVLRSCILRVGCQSWAYPTDTISRCVSQDAQNTYEGTKCTLDATSCDDITACEGKHIENTFCAGKADGEYCNVATNEVVTCGAYQYARDCTKEGGTCHDFGAAVDLDGNGSHVDCSVPATPACTVTNATKKCSNNGYAYQCQGNVAYGSKCANFAASCDTVGGNAGCYYPANTCAVEGVTCTNDRAIWCDGSSKATYDCGAVGLGCSTQGDYYTDGGRQCTAPGCTTDDLTTCQESCVKGSSKINLCYGGAKVTVDCKDYGFKKCAEYDYDCTSFAMNDCLYDTDVIHFADCEF